MLGNLGNDRLIERLFNVAMKDKFSQFYRKYEQEVVFEIWAEIMTKKGLNEYLKRLRLEPEMTIKEVMDFLNSGYNAVEVMIQQRQEEKRKKGN